MRRTVIALIPPAVALAACVISTDENLWKRQRDSQGSREAAADQIAGEPGGDLLRPGEPGRPDRPVLDGLRLEHQPLLDAKRDLSKPDVKLPADKLAPDLVAPCSAGTFQCVAGGTARYCKTTGNWLSVGSCPLGCDAPGKSCRVPSNVAATLMGSGTGDLVPASGVLDINTDTGAITGLRGAVAGLDPTSGIYFAQPSAGLGVFVVKKLTIPAGVTLHGVGNRALVLLASDAVIISGIIDVSAVDQQGGPGGGAGGAAGIGGTGTCGGGTGKGDNFGACCSSGGGGGGNGGAGGAGGASTCPSTHNYAGGGGGGVAGNVTLIPLAGGCGGAGGSKAVGESTTAPGPGGGGGGALQISSAVSISIASAGGINAGGGGGGKTVSGGGAGGGAGGSVLLEAPSLSFPTGAALAANGGGGGGGDCT